MVTRARDGDLSLVAQSYDRIVRDATKLLSMVLGAIFLVAFFALWFGTLGAGFVSGTQDGNVIGALGALGLIVAGVLFLLPWILTAGWWAVARVTTATGRPSPEMPTWLRSLITASATIWNVEVTE
jgi:hypothetical protein